MMANASKVLPKALPELTSMSDETITEKLNDVDLSNINSGSRKMCNTRPSSA